MYKTQRVSGLRRLDAPRPEGTYENDGEVGLRGQLLRVLVQFRSGCVKVQIVQAYE